MNIDAQNLAAVVQRSMSDLGYQQSQPRIGDGAWTKSGKLYLMEQKTERESIMPQQSWWTCNNTLLDFRPFIKETYRPESIDRLQYHQSKWMIALAQLRSDILNAKPRSAQICYRPLFAIPRCEESNFRSGFTRFHQDNYLNPLHSNQEPTIGVLQQTEYTDQRCISVQCTIVEIECDNYFGDLPLCTD